MIREEGPVSMCRSTATKAFSLAEVLVLIAVLVISVLGLIAAQIYAMHCGQFNRSRHTAATLLESELNYSRAQLMLKWTYEPSHAREPDEYHPDFETATESIYAPGTTGEVLKRLTTTVYWRDEHDGNQERSISGWTYVYLIH
jgi:Tfp pilus assembly protein PilE